ncbi:hypothetical protein DD592_26640 [Enterobacter cloacae complex sp. 2DZ2F20B]|nr:hypothetical protein DD592_26640 [Enterobacter cloacae complex sp. 2DZ2F20B]
MKQNGRVKFANFVSFSFLCVCSDFKKLKKLCCRVVNNINMNSIERILRLQSENKLSHDEKLLIKNVGPPRPDLDIAVSSKVKDKLVHRKFNKTMWLCGCNAKNALFCFVCTLMNNGDVDKAWTETGITDLKHLGEKVKKYRPSKKHLNLNVSFAVLGKVDIRNQLNSAYRENVERHNEQVKTE